MLWLYTAVGAIHIWVLYPAEGIGLKGEGREPIGGHTFIHRGRWGRGVCNHDSRNWNVVLLLAPTPSQPQLESAILSPCLYAQHSGSHQHPHPRPHLASAGRGGWGPGALARPWPCVGTPGWPCGHSGQGPTVGLQWVRSQDGQYAARSQPELTQRDCPVCL